VVFSPCFTVGAELDAEAAAGAALGAGAIELTWVGPAATVALADG
jgi:hypothetical protein